jgi:peptide/nickel transport system permease protein
LSDGDRGRALGTRAPRRRRQKLPAPLLLGAALVLLFVGIGLLSLVWTPYDPEAVAVDLRLLPPGTDGYLFGTDRLGRDVLTQVMAGARNSLLVGVVSTVAALIPGLLIGLAAAGSGPFWQTVLSRGADVGVALPGVLVALVLATSMGPGSASAITAIIVWFIPVVARVVIGPAKQVLSRDFVEAAFAYGRRRWYVLLRHVVPNIGPLLIVQASVMIALAILIEAALSFLGVGAQRPTPSWGRLLNEAQPLIFDAPYLMVFPGVAIMLAVLGFNLLGDGLRAILDPQQEARGAAV